MKTSHTPLCLFFARFSELEHEHLCDSVDRAEDARDWTRHMEEYPGTGRDIKTHTELAGPTNVFGHGGILKKAYVCLFVFSGEAGGAYSFRVWIQAL